jgi:hypothetical protein
MEWSDRVAAGQLRISLLGGDQRAFGKGHGDRVHPGIHGGDAIEVNLDRLTT